MATEQLRVLIVSADPLARAGLAAWLSADVGFDIDAAPAPESHEAMGAPPHVVVWDVGLDRGSASLRLPFADVSTVALVSDPNLASLALGAGARGVVFRDTPPTRLAEAIRAVAQGLVVLDEGLVSAALRPAVSADGAGLPEPLTAREREVLALLAEGLSNRLIAQRLGISEHTAKFHVNAILGKLGAESRTEALVLAARFGLVTI
jgi:two-component system, NarL family, nitrate/nitrite response regulator NarL